MGRFARALAAATLSLAAAAALFHAWREPTWVLTSFQDRPPLAPIYGFFLPAATPWIFAALAAVAAAILLARRAGTLPTPVFLVAAWALAAALALSVHAARSGGLPGRELAFYRGEEILEDAAAIRSVPEFLRTYTAKQPELSLHGRTKPPGFALLEYLLLGVLPGRERALGVALLLMAACLPLAVHALTRRLTGSEPQARSAALLASAIPASVLFGAVSLDAVFAVVAAVVLALASSLVLGRSSAAALGVGGALFVALMLSYSALIVGLIVLVWLALARRGAPRALAKDASLAAATLIGPFLVLRLAWGFDAWACFVNARRLNAEAMTAILGKPLATVWPYASVGNLLAFALGLGPAVVAALALLRRGDLGERLAPLAAASAIALLAACAGGVYLLETERILLLLVPAAAVLATSSRSVRPEVLVGASALTALLAELAIFTLW